MVDFLVSTAVKEARQTEKKNVWPENKKCRNKKKDYSRGYCYWGLQPWETGVALD